MYTRLLNPTVSFSFFLFGARGVGKTTYLQNYFEPRRTYWFDLLDIELEDRLIKNPRLFSEILSSLEKDISYIIIDEIQKIPKLLDLVHQFLQKNPDRFKFILTGSSARKLKRGGANMLAGRAFVYYMFPLCYSELNHDFNLNEYLKYGGLPQIYKFRNDEEKNHFLKAYALTYLKEEVWAEHLIQKLDPFRNFLEVAAQCNGDIINYSKIARQSGVTIKTVQVYFDILKETHIGIILDTYHSSVRKRLISSPKFYFLDTGIKRALDNTLHVDLPEHTYAYGKAFEHFVITQIFFLNEYLQKDYHFFYLKTKDGAEIDLIIEKSDKQKLLIEIKSTDRSEEVDVNNLRKFQRDIPDSKAYCITRDKYKRKKGTIEFFPWDQAFEEIFRK
ncbi:MAG: ATP-binding protein [bacterium]